MLNSSSSDADINTSEDPITAASPTEDGIEIGDCTPTVFLCASCNHIVGDSLTLCNVNKEAGTISLAIATNIKSIPRPVTSSAGYDVGSTYAEFICASCEV